MGPPPVLDHSRASLIWALWHNIDPALLAATAEEKADTISVQSYEVAYKYTPSNAFPSRQSKYANVIKMKARQNVERTRYSSTAPNLSYSTEEDEMTLQASASTLSELPPKEKYYKSDTFLTDVPEFYTLEPETTSQSKISMPAFLPTIQAKTHTKKLGTSQWLTVQKYLVNNRMANKSTDRKPFTAGTVSTDNTLTSMSVLRKSVLPRQICKTTSQKAKRRKTAKHKTKYKQAGKKKAGKLYIGRDRELSSTNNSSVTTTDSSRSFHSLVSPQEDLIKHFSRISMRQVQATLNNNRLALPSIA